DNIHTKLDFNIKNSPVLVALESPSNSSFQVTFVFQNFIAANQNEHKNNTEETENNDSKQNQDTGEIIPLQHGLIDKIT
ncbi:7110_t:CDS:2, partial [Racocetra fulgida]